MESKTSFMEVLEGYKKGEWTLDEAINILSKIEEETLQEQAKEIKEKLELGHTLRPCRDMEDLIQIRLRKGIWNKFWQKYTGKEEGKDENNVKL